MKFRPLPKFDSDWDSLKSEARAKFKKKAVAFSAACDGYAVNPSGHRWPTDFRVKKRKNEPGIWEMTWSFSGPDGRATFEFEMVEFEMRLIWRRIGSHEIYNDS